MLNIISNLYDRKEFVLAGKVEEITCASFIDPDLAKSIGSILQQYLIGSIHIPDMAKQLNTLFTKYAIGPDVRQALNLRLGLISRAIPLI